jgi:hypothetical protein
VIRDIAAISIKMDIVHGLKKGIVLKIQRCFARMPGSNPHPIQPLHPDFLFRFHGVRQTRIAPAFPHITIIVSIHRQFSSLFVGFFI